MSRLRIVKSLNRWVGSGGILAYHGVVERPISPNVHVTPDRLREQLAALCGRYDILPLAEYFHRRERSKSVAGCVAVTFDDAYAGVARLAAPILAELDIPATLFVVSRAAETGQQYWWDRAEQAFRAPTVDAWHELADRVGMSEERDSRAWDGFRRRVLVRHAGRMETQDIRASIDVDPDLRALRYDELAYLSRDDRFAFAVHTVTHACLAGLASAECEWELRECYRALLERLPRVQSIVAYPYGMYDRDTLACAQRVGLRGGVTMAGRAPTRWSNQYAVPRIGVMEDRSPRSLNRRLNGAWRAVHVVRDHTWHAVRAGDAAGA